MPSSEAAKAESGGCRRIESISWEEGASEVTVSDGVVRPAALILMRADAIDRSPSRGSTPPWELLVGSRPRYRRGESHLSAALVALRGRTRMQAPSRREGRAPEDDKRMLEISPHRRGPTP